MTQITEFPYGRELSAAIEYRKSGTGSRWMTFFHFDEPAENNRLWELAAVSIAAVVIVTGAATLSHEAGIRNAASKAAAAAAVKGKSDRLPVTLPDLCMGQTWGNWSDECISRLTNGRTTRFVRTVTIEERDVANRTSTLVRVAVR